MKAALLQISLLLFFLLPGTEARALESQSMKETVLAEGVLKGELIGEGAFLFTDLPPLPASVRGAFAGVHEGTLIVTGGAGVFVLPEGADGWIKAGELETAATSGACVTTEAGLVMVGGIRNGGASAEVSVLRWKNGTLKQSAYPDLPRAVARPSAALFEGRLYVAGGEDAKGEPLTNFWMLDPSAERPSWTELPAWPGPPRAGAALAVSQEKLCLIGGDSRGAPVLDAFAFTPREGWKKLGILPSWPLGAAAVAFGQSHIFLIGGGAKAEILAYHTISGTLATLGRLPGEAPGAVTAVPRGGQVVVLADARAFAFEPVPVKTGYNWIDHSVVALYLLAMVGMGFFFSRRESSSKDFFRGGNRIPWWASGMSLFATGASAISLMAMPGKAFAGDWTYLTISFYTVITLPILMFFLAPLVRRLKISTANEYLEKRFGIVARTLASVIFIFTQIAGRMASVMLLPAIALSAITGMSVITCILIMGVITTVYTFFGGLEAVVWTDTVQGFIMVASIGGCLILVLTKLEMGPVEMWTTANAAGKFHMFDFSWNITQPTMLIFFIATVFSTLGSVGDQNFVQRVQCTPDMRQTRLAVGMQLLVSVPMNLLLFSLGTALFLFYRSHPGDLDPLMKTDGIYPFFVAQQLPPGVSGIVVAALFAATMSTISSSICSVSDLGVQDFYRRFNPRATDHSSLVLGRILTAVVGIAGVGAAILLSKSNLTSVWDLAMLVIGLISSGIVGLFFLGLLTRRANEAGAVVGVLIGLAVIASLRKYSDVTFWLYLPIGSTLTFASGYLMSLILPGRPRDLAGLTIYTLPEGLFSSRDK